MSRHVKSVAELAHDLKYIHKILKWYNFETISFTQAIYAHGNMHTAKTSIWPIVISIKCMRSTKMQQPYSNYVSHLLRTSCLNLGVQGWHLTDLTYEILSKNSLALARKIQNGWTFSML